MALKPLSLEVIHSLCEVWEGFTLMDHYGIPKDHCASLQDIRDRLTLHHYRMQGLGRSPEAVSNQNLCFQIQILLMLSL